MLTNTFRLSLVLAFAAALTLAGLSRPRVADAQATTTTSNTQEPFAAIFFVPCANGGAGEVIEITGEIHVLTHTTINGNSTNLRFHAQPQGITAVGLTTGDIYRGTGGTLSMDTSQSDGATLEATFINNGRFLAPGPDNNLLIHSVSHFTINNNGEMTSSHTISSVECR